MGGMSGWWRGGSLYLNYSCPQSQLCPYKDTPLYRIFGGLPELGNCERGQPLCVCGGGGLLVGRGKILPNWLQTFDSTMHIVDPSQLRGCNCICTHDLIMFPCNVLQACTAYGVSSWCGLRLRAFLS